MKTKTTKEMENVIASIAGMTEDQQNRFYRDLTGKLTDAEIDCIKFQVTFWKMHNIPGFYDMIVEEMGSRLYNRLRG